MKHAIGVTLRFLSPLISLQVAGFATLSVRAETVAPEFQKAVEVILAVGPEGKGNAAAAEAWRRLAKGGPGSILPLLRAMDGANDYSLNWLHAAVDAVAEPVAAKIKDHDREAALPLFDLSGFLTEPNHHPRARQLAFELIQRVDEKIAQKMLAGMLNDSSMEIRRDAVDQLVTEAKASQSRSNATGAGVLLRQALAASRVPEQIDEISKLLEGVGQRVDSGSVFCFLTNWQVIGPFNNAGNTGYATAYPPEEKVDLTGVYEGLTNRVRWKSYSTTNQYGKVDMNENYGKLKSVVAYAAADFPSDRVQEVELRLGGLNSWKLWLNGKFLFGRDEYHLNEEIDQYRMPARLEAGHNIILVKVCQNAQTEDWAEDWNFQLRVTDALGTPILPAKTIETSTGASNHRAAN